MCTSICILLLAAAIQLSASAPVPGYGEYTAPASAAIYENVTLDLVDVGAALQNNATKQANFNAVKTIYANGKNVIRSPAVAGKSATYPIKEVYSTKYTGRPAYELGAAYYKDSKYLDTFIGAAVANDTQCCGARSETIRAGFRFWAFVWGMLKIDGAYNKALEKVATRDVDYINGHVDQAVAMWYGGADAGSNSPFGQGERFAGRTCTNTSTIAGVNGSSNALFMTAAKDFRAAAVKGDKAGMDKARASLQKAQNIVLLQMLKYNIDEGAAPPDGYVQAANKCLSACGTSVAAGISASKQAAALTYWRLLAPSLAVGAPKEVAAILTMLEKQRLDASPSDGLFSMIKTAASKNGIEYNKEVVACPSA